MSFRKLFISQKKIVGIVAAAKLRNSCRGLFERFEILHLPCERRFSLMKFSVNTKKNFKHIHLYIILIQRISTVFRA